MDLGLKGKQALVTGASRGIGYACAEALATEGVSLVINSRNEERLAEAAEKIKAKTSNQVKIVAGDISELGDRLSLVNATRDHFERGVVDILVCNTGGPPPGSFLDHSGEAWRQAGKLLLDSAVGLTRALLPEMVDQNWGRLIYITSVAVLQPVDSLILSNSYRAAVTGFCKSVSNTYARHKITANCVCPGYTATERLADLVERQASDEGIPPRDMARRFAEQVPSRRLGQPEELGSLVAFLASDRAAYITGSSLAVDGGLHRGLL